MFRRASAGYPRRMARRSLAAVSTFIGANLRRLRLKNGMTQELLAERVEVTARFIQRIERGDAVVSLAMLVRLADLFSIEPFQLLKPAKTAAPVVGRPPRRRAR